MSLALRTFDLGALSGEAEAANLLSLRTRICICSVTECGEDNREQLLRDIDGAQASEGEAEARGVQHLTNTIPSQSCIDIAVTAELFKQGFTCGYVKKLTSYESRREMQRQFANVFTDSPDRGRRDADDCWNTATPADR